MKVYAVILAGGRGSRLGSEIPKQFLMLGRKPLIAWSVDTFESSESIDGITIVVPKEFAEKTKKLARELKWGKIIGIAEGGATRQASSKNGIDSLACEDDDILLLHDAARPFVKQETIRDCISVAKEYGAAASYVPVSDTIAEIRNGQVTGILPRETLYSAQTPQAFRCGIIRQAHAAAASMGEHSATDDVSLVLAAGFPAAAAQGDPNNFKITGAEDYARAEQAVKNGLNVL